MAKAQRPRIVIRSAPALKPGIDAERSLLRSGCLECDWAGSTLDDARGHARRTPHTTFRTVTKVFSAAGQSLGELVEVHQF